MATPLVSISADETFLWEGDGGTQTATFTITRSGDLSAPSRVQYIANSDYLVDRLEGSVEFAPGQTEQTISVTWPGNDIPWGDDWISVFLWQPENALIAQSEAETWIIDDDDPVPVLQRPNLQNGSSAANQTLSGDADHNTFYFGAGAIGQDTVQGFGPNDVLAFTQQLAADLTLGDDRTLRLSGSNRVVFQGDGPDQGLRYLGRTRDGLHLYADAESRPFGAIEGRITEPDYLTATPDQEEIFFFDGGLDVRLTQQSRIVTGFYNNDSISNFGMEDLLVTTTRLNVEAHEDQFGIAGLNGSGVGAVSIFPWDDGNPVDQLQELTYFGSTTHEGRQYFVYGLPGSAHSPDEVLFTPPLSSSHPLRIAGFDTDEDVLTVPTEPDGEFSLAGYSGQRYFTMADASAGSSNIAGAQIVRWTGAAGAADTTAEVDALLQSMAGAGDGGVLFIGREPQPGGGVAIYYDSDPAQAGGVTIVAELGGLSGTTDLDASHFRPTGATLPILDIGPANLTLSEGDTGSTAFEFTVTRTGDLSEASSVQWKVLGSLPSGSVSFAPGQSSAKVVVNVPGDTTPETYQTFTVELAGPSGAVIGTGTAQGIIANDDSAPRTDGPKTGTAGDDVFAISPGKHITITGYDAAGADRLAVTTGPYGFSLAGDTGQRIYTMVDASTSSSNMAGAQVIRWTGDPTSADTVDEVDALLRNLPGAGSGGLLFVGDTPGDRIAVYYDQTPSQEGGTRVVATLEGVTSTTALNASDFPRTGTPLPTLNFTPSAIIRSEGDGASTAFEFTVTRTDYLSPSTLQWNVAGSGSAPAGPSDFQGNTLPSGSLTFADGEATAKFTVNIAGDTFAELDETFVVTLKGRVGSYSFELFTTAHATIANDDDASGTPVAEAGAASGTEDDAVITGSTLATDLNQDTLTYSLVGDAPAGVTFDEDGAFSVAPTAADQGLRAGQSRVVTFDYKANDGTADSNIATVTVTINGVNDAPTAEADSASVVKDQVVTIDVLANDTDVDVGDTRTITGVSSLGGGASIVAGKVVYTADADAFDGLGPGQSVTDSFTYTMKDAAGATSSATVSVVISGEGTNPNIVGTNGSEVLTGTAAANLIRAYGGSDTLNGFHGDDTLSGGNGEDSLSGGEGKDRLDGGDDADTLNGGAGDDLLRGAGGPDRFVFGPGFGHDEISDFGSDDLIQFDASLFPDFTAVKANTQQVGSDLVITYDAANTLTLEDVELGSLKSSDFVFATVGNNSSNALTGAGGADLITGYNGADTLSGGQGADTLAGGNGEDSLGGGEGKDRLDGGDNADTLNGGAGDDLLRGAGGPDRFVFGPGFGHDEISDLQSDDVIEFSASLFADYATMRSNAEQDGADVVITYDAANTVTLAGVQLSSLHSSDFMFA